MRRFFSTVAAAAAAGAVLGAVIAANLARSQPAGGSVNLPSPLTGNEIFSVLPLQGNGQPGAVIANVTLRQIADFIANNTLSTTTSGAVAAMTPTTILTMPLTGAITFTLPAGPTDGQVAVIVNGAGVGFRFTITASNGTVQNPTAVNMPAGGSARWRYTAATMTWMRIG